MSATPRTDEVFAKRHSLDAVAPWSLCMQLEIELAEVDQKWERRLIAALGGHADSKLWGDDGLIAATWRCVENYQKFEKDIANHQLSAEMDDFTIEQADWQKFYDDNVKKLRALLKG